jgi:predicted transcriptional regulator
MDHHHRPTRTHDEAIDGHSLVGVAIASWALVQRGVGERVAAARRRADNSCESTNRLSPASGSSGWFGRTAHPRSKRRAARSTCERVSIELSSSVEEQLRNLAARQGRDITALVEDAVRQSIEAAAITDVEASEVAEAQAALLSELPEVPVWKADKA